MMSGRRPNERTIADGAGARIVVLQNADGTCEVVEFLELLANDRPKDFAKIQALIDRVKEIGPQNVKNTERVKPLGDGLFELKAHQIRVLWIYGATEGSKRKVVLLEGLIKKRDRHRPSDLERARKLKIAYERGTEA